MRRRGGFTFIEVLLVVGIVGLLASLAMPKIKGAFLNARLKTGARELAGYLRFARNTAVLRERPCQITFDLEADKYWLTLLDENGEPEKLNKRKEQREKKELGVGEEAAGMRKLPPDVHFSIVYAGAPLDEKGRPRVIYYPDGSASPATVTIQGVKMAAFNVEVYQTTGIAHVEPGMPVKQPDKSRLYYGPKAPPEVRQ